MFATFILILFYRYDRVIASLKEVALDLQSHLECANLGIILNFYFEYKNSTKVVAFMDPALIL
jgi:hypothetical protein